MSKIIYKIFIGIFALIMIVSATALIRYYGTSYLADKKQKDFSDRVKAEQPDSPAALQSHGDAEETDINEAHREKYAELLTEYPDLVGWITIPGTHIDYPVMQRPGEGTEYYYLKHDYSGESSSSGSIFAHESCDIETPCNNIIIYGHNMKSGTMFHDLIKYEKKEFCTENPYITFDSLYKPGIYKVISAFYTRVSDDHPSSDEFFRYYEYTDMSDQDTFDEYIQTCERLSLYSTDAEVNFGDELITLSTCSYHLDDGSERFVVVAVRLDI